MKHCFFTMMRISSILSQQRSFFLNFKAFYSFKWESWQRLLVRFPLLLTFNNSRTVFEGLTNPYLSLLFIRSAVSDSLQSLGLRHARLPCPSLSPGVFSNSCPLSWLCHPTISSSVTPFYFCPQSFPASGSFPMSQLFASGSQSTGVSASASVLQMNIQDWFPLGLTGLSSLQSKGLSRVFSNTTVWKHQFFGAQPSLWTNSHICTWLLEKP